MPALLSPKNFSFLKMKPISNKNMNNNHSFLYYDVFVIICGNLVTQRDCETWHHCVEAGGSLKIAALESVGFADFQDIVFSVRSPSQETALQLFNALCEKHNPKDGAKKSQYQFCCAAREWLTLSVKHKFRQLSKAIVQIHGMEKLSFRDAMINAAIVGWDDLFQEWLKREKTLLRNDGQRYQFAQYLARSLHSNPPLNISQIEIVLREIRINSKGLRCDRMLAIRSSIIQEIQATRDKNESASITDLVRALMDVKVILPSNRKYQITVYQVLRAGHENMRRKSQRRF
jgi:hypothetical protein